MQKQHMHNIENNGVKRIETRWTFKNFLRCVHDVHHPPTLYFFIQSVEIFNNFCGFSALFGQTDFDAFPTKLVCDHTLSLNAGVMWDSISFSFVVETLRVFGTSRAVSSTLVFYRKIASLHHSQLRHRGRQSDPCSYSLVA